MYAVAGGIFEVIVDQSPYAIEDLMKELGSGSDEEGVSEDDSEHGNDEVLKTKGEERILTGLGNTRITKNLLLRDTFLFWTTQARVKGDVRVIVIWSPQMRLNRMIPLEHVTKVSGLGLTKQ